MAAYAALASLMHIIDAIKHHHSPPISIDYQQAQSLSQLVTSLLHFLEGYTTPATEIDQADPLEMRIAAAAYSAEDIIESRIVNRILRRTGISGFFDRFRAPKKPEYIPPFELQRVIEEMESIKKLTLEIDAQNQRPRSVDASASIYRSISARQNSITVCSDVVINEVMEKLARGRSDRHTVPIVGMGGIGKTTLAINVYEHPLIIEHFDIRAWATISQQYSTREILFQLLSQEDNKEREKLSEKSEDILGTELHQYLFGRRYLIVLDDMWSIDAWDKVQRLLPNNENGSRVIVTTRLSQLSYQLNENYRLYMKFLDETSSWDLFSKTVFGDVKSCPLELEKIGKKIVENCRGLPLSIVVVGGILKKMDRTQSNWESIGKNLSSLVNLENNKHCLRLLGMSYNHLPAYLKPCFLYMGVFEEDSEIKVSKLIKLWVCEGFLKPTYDKSLETIAKEFLRDLVDRNLILVHELASTGNIKFCKIHDLLRDLCLNESKKEGFYHVIGQSSSQGINGHRRVVIPRSTSKKKVRGDLRSMPHVRSIISKYGEVPSCRNLKLLRVVNASTRNYFYDGASRVNLRYLDVKVGSISSFLSLISLHWNLHTLIVLCPNQFTAPLEIWKMTYLRHIQFGNDSFFLSRTVILPDPPSDGVVMTNLQVLTGLQNFKFSEGVVERIPNIKKLAVDYDVDEGLTEHDDYYCLSNIRRLSKLESLHVQCWYWIGSRRDALNNLTFPHSLKKLFLLLKNFELNDLMEKIGSLPFLEKLDSWYGCFGTGEWEVAEGQFPRLKYMEISWCHDLKRLTTQEGSAIFPRLEQLLLSGLEELEEIPSEIGEIATLKRIKLVRCGASAVKCAKGIVEEQVELQGEQLPFHVQVILKDKNEELLSLAGPYFQVSVW